MGNGDWGLGIRDWGLENGGGALGAAFLLVIGWSVSPATGIYELSRHYRREEIIDGILGIIRRGWCSAMKECRRIWSTLRMALPVILNQEGDSSRS